MKRYSRMGRAAMGGVFGGGLAVLTGSTPIGIAIVAALGAGLAVKAGGVGIRNAGTGTADRLRPPAAS